MKGGLSVSCQGWGFWRLVGRQSKKWIQRGVLQLFTYGHGSFGKCAVLASLFPSLVEVG